MGCSRLFQLFIQLAQNIVHPYSKIPLGLVFQNVINKIGGRFVVTIRGSQMVLGSSSCIQQVQFFRILRLNIVLGLIDLLVGTGEIRLPDGTAGVPYHRLLHTVSVLVSRDDVTENALRLHIILLVEIGLAHHQVGIVNRLDVLLALEKHRMLVYGLRRLLNHTVHRRVNAGQFRLLWIAVYR